MLEHSINTYGPLPAELRRIRARKDSRPSPYPTTRFVQSSIASPPLDYSMPVEMQPPTPIASDTTFETRASADTKPVLQTKKLNTQAPTRNASKSATPLVVMKDKKGEDPAHKPSAVTKPVFGSGSVKPKGPLAAKRSILSLKSNDKKENTLKEGSTLTT